MVKIKSLLMRGVEKKDKHSCHIWKWAHLLHQQEERTPTPNTKYLSAPKYSNVKAFAFLKRISSSASPMKKFLTSSWVLTE
ncbi:hypothetical protein E2320_004170 [Naja naja]|nr:hypothetical protein E2320_004170 [Naja naja]